MEEVKISYISHYHHDDFDELNVRINDAPARPVRSQLADDPHNVYLQIDAENQCVIGATILYADDWFEEIAQAFQRHDLDHPAVRFFLEQQVQMLAQRWTAQRPTSVADPSDNGVVANAAPPQPPDEPHAAQNESAPANAPDPIPDTTLTPDPT
jgi:hypothetical protein